MLVRERDRIYLEAPVRAEPAENVLTSDYYTLLPQIRLTGDSTDRPMLPETSIAVTLDGNDVAKLVECAVRHPSPNMRYAVLAAIWSHPASFRQIFEFGLSAAPAFSEIREIVADELAKLSATAKSPTARRVKPAAETLLPRMPPPAHLRGREE
jgi:hypothetical protein